MPRNCDRCANAWGRMCAFVRARGMCHSSRTELCQGIVTDVLWCGEGCGPLLEERYSSRVVCAMVVGQIYYGMGKDVCLC